MSLEANKFRLGVFFFLSAVLFISAMVWLTGWFDNEKTHTYVCYFDESVQGLEDGSTVRYNGVPVGTVEGLEITTIDGFRGTDRYRIISEAFSAAGSVQCGFCTPGFVMAAEALFRTTLEPTEEQIRNAVSGNLCRCTGYNMIIDGIRGAARMIREREAE